MKRKIPVRLKIRKLFSSSVESKRGKSQTAKFSVHMMEKVLTIVHKPLYYGPSFPIIKTFPPFTYEDLTP